MISFILGMAVFQDTQKKAQAEIDEIVGQDRMPNHDDQLPYISALVKEILRWRCKPAKQSTA